MAVKPIPDGYRTVTPYLTIQGVREALAFLQKVFDAKVVEKHDQTVKLRVEVVHPDANYLSSNESFALIAGAVWLA